MTSEEQRKNLFAFLREHPPREPMPAFNKAFMGLTRVTGTLARAGKSLTPAELCRLTGMTSARMAAVLGKLESRGLVERTPDPGDGRKQPVRLTEKGEALAAENDRKFCEAVDHVIARVGYERMMECFRVHYEMDEALAEFRKESSFPSGLPMEPEGPGRLPEEKCT